ncbi:MAG TPA: hypothetical protein VGX50_06715, partial [Longimicrobium sp.]|nr:hypothetical protein [Longimicrobium sp.]
TVPIGRGGSAGAGLVERIVPYTVAFPEQTPATLGREIRDRISAAVRDSRRIRAASEVKDVRLTARLEQDPQPVRYRGSTPVRAVLQSGARCVTYAIAPRGEDAAWIRIPPGGSAPHVIQARSPLGLLQALPWNEARTETLQATPDAVPVTADVAFEPADSLVALELNPASRRVRIAAAGTVEHRPMPWSEFLAALAAVGVLALLAWMGMRRPRLWGEVIIHPEKKRTELGEHATSRTLVTLPNGVRLEFVARKRNPLAKGYNSRVGVRATDGTPLRVRDREGPRAADPSGTVWLDDESTITATSADGNAASATWR